MLTWILSEYFDNWNKLPSIFAFLFISDMNTTLKIGITVTWSFTLRYAISIPSLWRWKKISMSVQCKYIIGLHRDKNPIIIGCRHNIACPLGWCPEIMNGSVNVYQICNNPNCCKKLIVPAGGTLVTCCSCQRRLLFKKASVELNLVV